MAARFPLITDIHVHDALVEALRRAGWEEITAKPNAFAYPTEYIKPKPSRA